MDCFTKVVKEGGFIALYRGLPVALAGVVLFKALFMGGYDTSKVILPFYPVNHFYCLFLDYHLFILFLLFVQCSVYFSVFYSLRFFLAYLLTFFC